MQKIYTYCLCLFLTHTFFLFATICNKTLTCKIEGGLGNQLFQVATTLATAWDQGYEPIFLYTETSPSFVQPRPTYWSTMLHKISTITLKDLPKSISYVEPRRHHFDPIRLHSSHMQLEGYWQSEKYFVRHSNRIRELFSLPPIIEDAAIQTFNTFVKDHTGPIVSVHLRRGDYLLLSNIICLWKEEFKHYYEQAISLFPSTALFMVFSDDPVFAQVFFANNFPHHHAIFPQEEDFIELYMMSRCDHHILANSTFSWWGAYLNANPNKTVIAPREWGLKHAPAHIRPDFYPTNWITIPVLQTNN